MISTEKSSKGRASSSFSCLQVTVYWGDVFYDTIVCAPEDSVKIGGSPQNDIVVPFDGNFRRPSLELIKVLEDNTVEVRFDNSIEGHVYFGETYLRLNVAIEQKKAVPEADGVYRLHLNVNDRGTLVIGHLSFVLVWVHERILLPRGLGGDKRAWRVTGWMTLLVVASVLFVSVFHPTPEPAPERIVELISNIAPPPPQPKMRAKAAIGERKTADGGAAKGESGKATLSPKAAPLSEAEKLRRSLGGSDVVKELAEVGTRAPDVARSRTGKAPSDAVAAAIEQAGNGGMSTIGTGKGAGGKTVGIGRVVGNGEGGFGGTGRLGLSGNSATEGGTGHGRYETVAEGGLEREVIDVIVRKRKDRIRLCYERQLNFKSDLAGKITVHFVIGAQGQVLQASIVEDTMKNASVNGCIVAEAKTWQFPPPKNGTSVNVDYPFVFDSSVKQ